MLSEAETCAELDAALKIAQICFYVVVGSTAVLTYRAAKRALLNTVHTEYHKHVIEALKQLSTDLLAEFDHSSEHYWAKNSLVADAVNEINQMFAQNRKEILASGEFPTGGIPMSKDEMRLWRITDQVKSNPFLPAALREAVVDLLGNRFQILNEVRVQVLREYTQDLAQGKHVDSLATNQHWLHNKVNDALYERGCGIGQIDEAVQKLRLSIQEYFRGFDPLR